MFLFPLFRNEQFLKVFPVWICTFTVLVCHCMWFVCNIEMELEMCFDNSYRLLGFFMCTCIYSMYYTATSCCDWCFLSIRKPKYPLVVLLSSKKKSTCMWHATLTATHQCINMLEIATHKVTIIHIFTSIEVHFPKRDVGMAMERNTATRCRDGRMQVMQGLQK